MPLVDLSTSLAELLREGLPSLPGRAGNIGGEYLNIMFGALPLHSDLSDLVATARRSDKLLRQYERDAGRWVRRSYEFPEVVESSTINQGTTYPIGLGVNPSGMLAAGTLTSTTVSRTKTWFDGAFTYYLPRKGWRRTVAEFDYLYGIKPGVDTVYQLTAFSWLADYFANMGDVLSNINAFSSDGLVMPYGYVMQKRQVVVEQTWRGNGYVGKTLKPVSVSSEVSYVSHQRRLATPFGFGLSDDGLSTRQKAILVALGISRL